MRNLFLSFCLAATSCSLFAQSMTPKDSQFITDALQASMLEIKLSELSITNATSSDVKRLGQQIIKDHTKINTELKTLAVSKNINPPTVLNTEGQSRYDELAKKTGSSFDHAYNEMIITDHQKMVTLFKDENLSGSDTETKNWAAITLPALEHHLMIAKDTDAVLNKK